jgi:hypothetical protein
LRSLVPAQASFVDNSTFDNDYLSGDDSYEESAEETSEDSNDEVSVM